MKSGLSQGKDDSDYLAFKETTWSYRKFVCCSAFLCKPVLLHPQPFQICCMTITNMQTELRYVHLYETCTTCRWLNNSMDIPRPNTPLWHGKNWKFKKYLEKWQGLKDSSSTSKRFWPRFYQVFKVLRLEKSKSSKRECLNEKWSVFVQATLLSQKTTVY